MTELERLREALEKYGQHDAQCTVTLSNGNAEAFHCDCGFDDAMHAALAATPPGAERGEWKLVPIVASVDMITAGSDHKRWGQKHFKDPGYAPVGNIYEVMVAAAPPSPPASEGEK